MFVKKETVQPGKTVVQKDKEGKDETVKVKVEIEVFEPKDITEAQNSAGSPDVFLAYIRQCIATDAANEFRISYKAAITEKKTEDEALKIARAAAKNYKPSVRGPGKKEVDAKKNAMLAELLAGLNPQKKAELEAKYGVSM